MIKGIAMLSDETGRALWRRKPKWEALSPSCLLSKSVRFLVAICFFFFLIMCLPQSMCGYVHMHAVV